jgi:hypothetical protein
VRAKHVSSLQLHYVKLNIKKCTDQELITSKKLTVAGFPLTRTLMFMWFHAGVGEFFSSPPRPGPTQPPIQWVLSGAVSLGIKWPRREADHCPPSSAEIKEWVELYLHSLNRLHGVVLSLEKHRDKFTFTTRGQQRFQLVFQNHISRCWSIWFEFYTWRST